MRDGIYLTGGTAKGAKLFSVPGRDVRPATSRVRISLFEILKPRLAGARAVDLFAGTGSLGLEAISRGAAFCTFFDTDPRSVEALRRNLAKLKFEDRAEVRKESAFRALDVLRDPVDLLFVDPPYAFYDERRDEISKLLADWIASPLLRGLILVERRPGQTLDWPGRVVDERSYGGTVVTFLGVNS